MNSDKPDVAMQGRLDRASGRQFSPRTERFQTGIPGSSGRSGVPTRNRSIYPPSSPPLPLPLQKDLFLIE